MQSNKNSCVEKEIAEQPEQSAARDHVRRRRSCETEQQTVAWRPQIVVGRNVVELLKTGRPQVPVMPPPRLHASHNRYINAPILIL